MGEYEHETVDAIMNLNPCPDYPVERVEALVQRLATETPFEVLASIPAQDAYWFIANALPKPERVQWAEACARRAKAYADCTEDDAFWAYDAAAADASARAADAADAAYWAADAADAAYWAAAYAARAAYYAGGEDAQRAEHSLVTRHGLMLLEGAK